MDGCYCSYHVTIFTVHNYDWFVLMCAFVSGVVNKRVREADGSIPKPVKSYTALQTVRHRFNIYARSCVALVLRRGVGHANSLHASAYIASK